MYDWLYYFKDEDLKVPETLEEARMTLKVIDGTLTDIVDTDDDVRFRIGFDMERFKRSLLGIYNELEALRIFVQIEQEAIEDVEEDEPIDEEYLWEVQEFEDDIFDTNQVFELACKLTDPTFSLPKIDDAWYDRSGTPHAVEEQSPADILSGWVMKRRVKS